MYWPDTSALISEGESLQFDLSSTRANSPGLLLFAEYEAGEHFVAYLRS
jgi:hypothetical protein